MNQIIYSFDTNPEPVVKNIKRKNLLKFLPIILIIISAFLSIYYVLFRYDLYKSEKISQKLIDNYSITRSLFYKF